MGVITFDGISSSSIGVTVEGYSSAPMAEKSVERVSVPGRNGDLIVDNGSFLGYNQKYKMHWRRSNEARTTVTNWLYKDGYKAFADSNDPQHFRMANFVGGVEVDNRMDVLDRAEFEFHFKPQRFLTSGDVFTEYSAASFPVYNPTAFDSKPIVRLYGTGYIRFANGAKITVNTTSGDYIEFDCETLNAVDSNGANANSKVTVLGVPVLPSVGNVISKTLAKVEIKPRWWEL